MKIIWRKHLSLVFAAILEIFKYKEGIPSEKDAARIIWKLLQCFLKKKIKK